MPKHGIASTILGVSAVKCDQKILFNDVKSDLGHTGPVQSDDPGRTI